MTTERAAGDIQQVLDELTAVVADQRRGRSPLGCFAALYRQVTLKVRDGIAAGVFEDGDRMSRFDAAFANRYLDALRAWRAGTPTSRSWRVVFECADLPDRLVLQHLLLGINAHINLDLAVAAAAHRPGPAIHELRVDFHRINDLLEEVLDPAQGVLSRFSPLLGVLDVVGARTDEQVLGFSVRRSRADAWRHAVLLAHQPPELRGDAITVLDRKTAFLGRLVGDPGGLAGRALEIISATESDDVVAIIDALDRIVDR